MPYIASIFIYPVKSLDATAVNRATVLASGALEGDRAFVILDEKGQFVNGKRNTKVHLLRSSYHAESRTVCLQVRDTEEKQEFHCDRQRTELETWLSEYFGFAVHLDENSLIGFPDDLISPGPTIISTATILEAASWFPGMSADEMRRRMRANIEIDGVPAFWEDGLFSEADEVVDFKIGEVRFEGVNPCQRCIVPTRNSQNGEAYPNFQKIFAEKRRETLPSWVTQSRFNHFYRLSVNTRVPESSAGKVLQVGDEVEIIGVRKI